MSIKEVDLHNVMTNIEDLQKYSIADTQLNYHSVGVKGTGEEPPSSMVMAPVPMMPSRKKASSNSSSRSTRTWARFSRANVRL